MENNHDINDCDSGSSFIDSDDLSGEILDMLISVVKWMARPLFLGAVVWMISGLFSGIVLGAITLVLIYVAYERGDSAIDSDFSTTGNVLFSVILGAGIGATLGLVRSKVPSGIYDIGVGFILWAVLHFIVDSVRYPNLNKKSRLRCCMEALVFVGLFCAVFYCMSLFWEVLARAGLLEFLPSGTDIFHFVIGS